MKPSEPINRTRSQKRWSAMRDWTSFFGSLPEHRRQAAAIKMGVREVFNIPYGRDHRQRYDVFIPTEAQGPLPVVFFIHGGGWRQGSKELHRYVGYALAHEGVVAVLPSYRLVPRAVYPAQIEDISLALRSVAEEISFLGGDPSRVVVTGQSAGGHLAALAVCDPKWTAGFRAAGGVVRGWAPISGIYSFGAWDDQPTKGLLRDFVNDPALWEEAQPIRHVLGNEPPCLILHGSDDWLVNPQQALSLNRKLVAAGTDVQLVLFPALRHIDIIANFGREDDPTRVALASFVRRVTRA